MAQNQDEDIYLGFDMTHDLPLFDQMPYLTDSSDDDDDTDSTPDTDSGLSNSDESSLDDYYPDPAIIGWPFLNGGLILNNFYDPVEDAEENQEEEDSDVDRSIIEFHNHFNQDDEAEDDEEHEEYEAENEEDSDGDLEEFLKEHKKGEEKDSKKFEEIMRDVGKVIELATAAAVPHDPALEALRHNHGHISGAIMDPRDPAMLEAEEEMEMAHNVKLVMAQTDVTYSEALQALRHNNGQLLGAVMDLSPDSGLPRLTSPVIPARDPTMEMDRNIESVIDELNNMFILGIPSEESQKFLQ